MATIKVKYRPTTRISGSGHICYQITHGRNVRRFNTDYLVKAEEWDENRECLIFHSGERRPVLLSIRERMKWDIELLGRIIRRFEERETDYTSGEVIDEFRRCSREETVFNYMSAQIARLKRNGNIRTSETYASSLNSFRKFRHQEDLLLQALTSDVMESFEAWHRSRGVSANTISFYIRNLRAVYRRAVDEDRIKNLDPFRHVYTGVDKTVKRAIPIEVIRKLQRIDLTDNPNMDYARDMFLLSFMLRGMSFVDMAYLRKSDLCDGYVSYRRRKTGQLLRIAWTTEMQRIVDKYKENESNYLLPIIIKEGVNPRWCYLNRQQRINYNLKILGMMVGLTIPLTMYVARHSWASAAKKTGIPISVISEGMGHDSESTTQIYLASLDTSEVDRANAAILSHLL